MDKITITPCPATTRNYSDFSLLFVAGKAMVINMAIIKVDFNEAHELLTKNKSILLFDVREEEEYITGHAMDAELFTLADINEKSAEEKILSKDTPVMVYCRSGVRSRAAAEKLSELGYKTIYDIGSLIGWPFGLF